MKNLLMKYNIVKTGHFKLSSGRHSNQYINKDAIYCNRRLFSTIVMKMWNKINAYENEFDIITGPAIAGAVLAAPIVLLFDEKIFVYPEKIDGDMVFRRGYNKIIKNKIVWIVEDVITTGSSVEKTIKAIEDCGGSVLGVSAIWNRCGYKPSKGLFIPLIDEIIYSHLPENCPECANNIPLTDPKD